MRTGAQSRVFATVGSSPFALKAIIVAIVADALLLTFIFLRRTYRRKHFAKRDARVFEFRQKWVWLPKTPSHLKTQGLSLLKTPF